MDRIDARGPRRRAVAMLLSVAIGWASAQALHAAASASAGAQPLTDAAAGDMGSFVPAVRGERTQEEPLPADPAFPGTASYTFGTSVQGRPLVAFHRKGSASPTRVIAVFGVIHGDERAGRLVTDALLTATLPADVDLWIVPTINPDGEALGRHQNANRVDLNRNFPVHWETGTYFSSGKYFSGAAPASEPETRATMALIELMHPTVSVWYHQPLDHVDCDEGRVGDTCVSFAAKVQSLVRLSVRPGTETDWTMTAGHGVSFVHEFPYGTPSAGVVAAHVAALLSL